MKRFSRLALLVSCAIVVWTAEDLTAVQTTVIRGVPLRVFPSNRAQDPAEVNQPGVKSETAVQNPQGTVANKTASEANPLAAALLKQQYQRTPALVLEAWNQSRKKVAQSVPVKSGPVEVVVLNAFEDFVVASCENLQAFKVGVSVHLTEPPAEGTQDTLQWKATVLSVDNEKASFKLAKSKGELPNFAKDAKLMATIDTQGKQNANATPSNSIDAKAKAFHQAVMLGEWGTVKTILAEVPESSAPKVYQHLLQSIGTAVVPTPPTPEQPGQAVAVAQPAPGGAKPPTSFLTPIDIFELIAACPGEFKKDYIPLVSTLVTRSLGQGHSFLTFIEKLEAGTGKIGGKEPAQRLLAARLLMQSQLIDNVESFLPALADEATLADPDILSVWSEYALARHAKDSVAEWLNKAWEINQVIASHESSKPEQRDLAMSNLIELVPKVETEVGQKWLESSFTESPERGVSILANLGTKSAEQLLNSMSVGPTQRLRLLRLQNHAVESLVKVAPEAAGKWKNVLTLLAQNWVDEASLAIRNSAQNSRQPFMQIDMYGNYYWMDPAQMAQMRGARRERPVKIGDLLVIAPSAEWQELLDGSLHLMLNKAFADLHLRVNEEDRAFPYIEKIAPTHPEIARELVHSFLDIWTRNHDPNTDKRRRNPYIYIYGFDQKAEAIPLTRSKQERNIRELSEWVKRIRKMPIDKIDESRLANAFTTCHSSAEVFRLDRVKSVFGELDSLKPETVAAICQKMRANLASNWREVKVQEQMQTRRREPEVQQEVLRGYDVAITLATESLQSSPDNWQLHLALACLMHDQNWYSQTVQKSSEFSERRDRAFDQF